MRTIDIRKAASEFGVEGLTNQELIRLLIRSGNRLHSAEQIANEFLNIYPDFNNLDYATITQLQQISGIGMCRAIEIKAAIELGKRVQLAKTIRYEKITSSQKVGELLIKKFTGISQENVAILYLDTKNQVIKFENIFKGTLNSATVHPRDIFRRCLQLSASKFIMAHNHPSGVISVSEQDMKFTNRLLKCGEVIGCELLDHLIIGKDSYLSLKEEGLM